MVINNEHEYNTSEKSARYTPIIIGDESSFVTSKEVELYNKCVAETIKRLIQEEYLLSEKDWNRKNN